MTVKARVTLVGTQPLLVHNPRLADPLDPIAKDLKAVSGKRKKTDDDHERMAEIEFQGGLYYAEDIGPFVPGTWIKAALKTGGTITKQGQQVSRGVFVNDAECPIAYPGPRDLAGLTADHSFRARHSVKVGQQRVMRTRPMFPIGWVIEADLEIDAQVINVAEVREIGERTGNLIGLGDFRVGPYGRFRFGLVEL